MTTAGKYNKEIENVIANKQETREFYQKEKGWFI
jgi:hypothetical protein